MKALIVYSGGMDSTTLLHEYKSEIELAISFDYGSNHNDKEFHFAEINTTKLKIPHLRINLKEVFKSFESTLLSGAETIPEGHYADENMKKTVVPFRNGIMLSIAAGIAASKGLDTILIGAHGGDHAIYPDCRPEFIDAINNAVTKGLWENVKILAPYLHIDKGQIAQIGKRIGVDYAQTYTCYKGGEVHCGVCGACTERKESLAGFDPTFYAK